MKNISIIVPGADESADIHDLQIQPGTTANDALAAIGKPTNWQLQRKGPGGFQTIAGRETIYDSATDGDKLFAVPKDIVVG